MVEAKETLYFDTYKAALYDIMMEIPQLSKMIIDKDREIRATYKDSKGKPYFIAGTNKDQYGNLIPERDIHASDMPLELQRDHNRLMELFMYGDKAQDKIGLIHNTKVKVR